MGKIRIKTLGDETAEKKQKVEAKKRSEAKKTEKQSSVISYQLSDGSQSVVSTPDLKTDEQKTDQQSAENRKQKTDNRKSKGATKKPRSNNYVTKASLADKKQNYSLSAALTLLPKLNLASFDETVELHINTIDKGISGIITLPHGTGKQIRVEILNPQEDAKHVEEVIKKIEAGNIDFDVLIATPDSMPKLAKVAKFLGPKGLMPNPKNGTVTPKPQDIAKKYAGGQIHYKTEAKFPLLHISVGKLSFGDKKLAENIKTFIGAIDSKNIKNVTLKSTMSPGIKLDFTTL